MAISFAHVSIHSRSKGHSAVAAAAYRAGIKLYDERLGKNYDFTNRQDVQFTDILLPEGANKKFADREYLWNEAERAENRKNSQVSKDFVLALPKELDLVHQIELAKRFANLHFVDNQIPADIAIHDHGDGNPHAHILITTRRLIGDRFDTHKARDLNPEFGRGYIKEEDHWNDKWREFQDSYFSEKGFDLSVDFDHIIPEKHHGGFRDKANHYIHEENELIKEARQDIVLHDIENFINILSIEHSVFTKRDIEILLFKTLKDEKYNEFFQVSVERVLSNKNVIFLGDNANGHQSFTTKHQFKQEARLLKNIEKLDDNHGHVYKDNIEQYVKQYALNDEQKQAFQYIVNGRDISCVIGRPGVGKSYMLTPVKSFYEKQGCRVLGAALSGKVSKQLHAETGMKTSTLASLTYRLVSGSLRLTEDDVLIIDEAGMVDFSSMSAVVEHVQKAGAKLILVGDPNQLKPIKKGSIFKGISDHVGCFTMVDIQRQVDLKDREASMQLANGNIEDGLRHYFDKGAITLADNKKDEDASTLLIHAWRQSIQTQDDLHGNIIFAHANSTVDHLNLEARQHLESMGLLGSESFVYLKDVKGEQINFTAGEHVLVTHTDNKLGLMGGERASILNVDLNKNISLQTKDGKVVIVPSHLRRYIQKSGIKDITLAQNERIHFKKDDRDIGVKNGDIGTIRTINKNSFEAILDSGETVTVPKKYKQLDYAYALTVHKSQGMSVKNVFVCIDTSFWDRMLSFVAFTRHKESIKAFANNSNYKSFKDLVGKLSRRTISDNVIDYPLNLGLRYGFGFDGLIGRAVNHLSGAKQAIQDKATYFYNYLKAYKKQQQDASFVNENTKKQYAKEIATYLDMKSKLKSQNNYLKERSKKFGLSVTELDDFDSFYKLSCARDKKAVEILKLDSQTLNSITMKNFDVEKITAEANRHDMRDALISVLNLKDAKPEAQPELSRKLSMIDVDSNDNQIILEQLAKKHGIKENEIINTIEPYQKEYRTKLLNDLMEQSPTLREYVQLSQEPQKTVSTFANEQKNNKLTSLARAVASDKVLSAQIKQYLPKLRHHLNKNIQRGLDKDRGIAR